MNETNKTVFIVTSLSILAVFFLLVMYFTILGQGGLTIDKIQQQQVVEKTENVVYNSNYDPLITPAKDVIESYITEDDEIKGKKNSEIKIIEFGDFECPYCQQFAESMDEVWSEYSNRVAFVWKDFPNPSHLEARNAAVAARCAGEQGKFWLYHDSLFLNQDLLSRELYNLIANDLNLDMPIFNRCLDGSETINKVGEGLQQGQDLGVDETPFIFIGNQVFNYALTADELREVLDEELVK